MSEILFDADNRTKRTLALVRLNSAETRDIGKYSTTQTGNKHHHNAMKLTIISYNLEIRDLVFIEMLS